MSGDQTLLASLDLARAGAEMVASAMARNMSSSALTPAACARIEGPDMAIWLAGEKSRDFERFASMLAPP